jgi:hypothetical protein
MMVLASARRTGSPPPGSHSACLSIAVPPSATPSLIAHSGSARAQLDGRLSRGIGLRLALAWLLQSSSERG